MEGLKAQQHGPEIKEVSKHSMGFFAGEKDDKNLLPRQGLLFLVQQNYFIFSLGIA